MPIKRFAKFIRVLTVAPLMALALLVGLYFSKPVFFGNILNFWFAVLFLVIMPLLAYPLQPLIPKFKDKGREGQRNLAIAMAGIGYGLCIVTALSMRAPGRVWIVYLTYLISGLLIILFNKGLKIRASGHACGVAGPIFVALFFWGPWVLSGLAVLASVFWASLHMKRHTWAELLTGSAISGFALLVSVLAVSILPELY